MIKSDSALVVGWEDNKVDMPWNFIQDLNLINLLCIEVDCIGIKQIYRESNNLANYLAKTGCNRQVSIWALLDS